MKALYNRDELRFALIWIGIYVIAMMVGDNVSTIIGIKKIVTAPLAIGLTVFIYRWISKYNLKKKYGLCPFAGSARTYLFFIPLMALATTNLWWGVRLNFSMAETALYVVSMVCAGFLEEIIFRGFLFKALSKTNIKRAIIISSVTFGLGHIVNLLSGKAIPETLLQIAYAVAVGFLFTIIVYKLKTLWPCIITHSAINSLSAFANPEGAPFWHGIASAAFLCVVSLLYAIYIIQVTRSRNNDSVSDA